jgi:hypothetical protein
MRTTPTLAELKHQIAALETELVRLRPIEAAAREAYVFCRPAPRLCPDLPARCASGRACAPGFSPAKPGGGAQPAQTALSDWRSRRA